VLAVAGCSSQHDLAVEIPFAATMRGAPFSCSTGTSGVVLSDLRLYVHDVALIDAGGNATPVVLTDDGVWQSGGVALLDFENATDNCADGTAGIHTTLAGRAAAGAYHALQLVVGVPFDRNHADAATADAPLNLGRMHWGWQGGYKFLRFEGSDGHAAFRFHLGSTGCEGTIGNISSCRRPNRARIHLDGFAPGRDVVQIELSALSGVRCMSEKDDANCRGPFAALGLDVASGSAVGRQTLFKVAAIGGAS
jgi:uncharacterized repeat protein (TIGR04052 family)